MPPYHPHPALEASPPVPRGLPLEDRAQVDPGEHKPPPPLLRPQVHAHRRREHDGRRLASDHRLLLMARKKGSSKSILRSNNRLFIFRLFLKERIIVLDIVNLILVFVGMIFIIQPPFIFDVEADEVTRDMSYYVAAIVVLLGCFLQANVYVLLRLLKGKFVFSRHAGLLFRLLTFLQTFTMPRSCSPSA